MNIWIGFEYLSTVFFAIEGWFVQIFNAIQENGLISFLTVMAGIVILLWIFRAVGGAFTGSGTDAVSRYYQNQKSLNNPRTNFSENAPAFDAETWREFKRLKGWK